MPVQEIRGANPSFGTHRLEGHFGKMMHLFFYAVKKDFDPVFPQTTLFLMNKFSVCGD
jgi:hypothetical protein